jgi:hypothetical protein
MRKIPALVFLVFLAWVSQAGANPVPWGGIQPSGDTSGELHYVFDTGPGLLVIYIVVTAYPSSEPETGCRFSAPKPSCFAATYLSDIRAFPMTDGTSQTGVTIHYGQCRQLPIYVLGVNYFVQGLTAECCWYLVEPDPNNPSGRVEVWDCNDSIIPWSRGAMVVNPGKGCAVPVEQTTWGRLKSLYVE